MMLILKSVNFFAFLGAPSVARMIRVKNNTISASRGTTRLSWAVVMFKENNSDHSELSNAYEIPSVPLTPLSESIAEKYPKEL